MVPRAQKTGGGRARATCTQTPAWVSSGAVVNQQHACLTCRRGDQRHKHQRKGRRQGGVASHVELGSQREKERGVSGGALATTRNDLSR